MSNSNNLSYASIYKKIEFSECDQAIALPFLENTKIEDHLRATGNKGRPKNILAAARISQGLIRLYLSSARVANELVKSHADVVRR